MAFGRHLILRVLLHSSARGREPLGLGYLGYLCGISAPDDAFRKRILRRGRSNIQPPFFLIPTKGQAHNNSFILSKVSTWQTHDNGLNLSQSLTIGKCAYGFQYSFASSLYDV